MLFDPRTDIALISVGLSVVSQVLRRVFTNPAEMKKNQEKMKQTQNRMKELATKTDTKAKNEIEALQQEMLEDMNKMMQGTSKMMMFSLVIFVPTFWVLADIYEKFIIKLPIPIPWFGGESFIQLYNETSWLGWYVLCSLVSNIILNMLLNLKEKMVIKK